MHRHRVPKTDIRESLTHTPEALGRVGVIAGRGPTSGRALAPLRDLHPVMSNYADAGQTACYGFKTGSSAITISRDSCPECLR